jgi:hypothetical protein
MHSEWCALREVFALIFVVGKELISAIVFSEGFLRSGFLRLMVQTRHQAVNCERRD